MAQPWTIMVTEEQKENIRGFFVHFGWDLIEVGEDHPNNDSDGEEGQVGELNNQILGAIPLVQDVNPLEAVQEDDPPNPLVVNPLEAEPEAAAPDPVPAIPPIAGAVGCPECYSVPCVLQFPQAWFGIQHPPHARNNAIRKKKYKNFWRMLDQRGAWRDPRYLAKKAQRARDDHFTVWSRREIMPDCVIDFVRGLYPNLPGRPYMGHRWQ